MLVAYNWPKDTDRYRRIEKFIEAFFPRLAEFQKAPRHPKWVEANLSATIPNWKRFPAAEEWVKRYREQQEQKQQVARKQFDQFVAARTTAQRGLSGEDRDQLFQEFLKWNQARERR